MANTSVKLFGKEPALVGAFLTSLLALALGFGVPGLSTETVGLITAAGAALFGAYVAYSVKQNLLPAIVAAFQALVAVGVGYGLDFLTPEKTALATATLTALLGMFLRTQADPKAGSPAAPAPVPLTPIPVVVEVGDSVARHSSAESDVLFASDGDDVV